MRHPVQGFSAIAGVLALLAAACGGDGATTTTGGEVVTTAAATTRAPVTTATPTAPSTDPEPPDPSGQWTALDTDGSTMWMFIDRIDRHRFWVLYFDDRATVCADPEVAPGNEFMRLDAATLESVGTMMMDGTLELEPADFTCMRLGESLGTTDFPLFYDEGRDVLTDKWDINWHRADFTALIHPAEFMPECSEETPDVTCALELFWDYEGFEDDPTIGDFGATHLHTYGGGFGVFIYWVNLPYQPEGTVSISARLSSEFPLYDGPPDGLSEVTLLVNGESAEPQQVGPDDGSGQWYEWLVPADWLASGRNQVVFDLRDAPEGLRNGLAIYADAVVAGEDDAFIVIRFDA